MPLTKLSPPRRAVGQIAGMQLAITLVYAIIGMAVGAAIYGAASLLLFAFEAHAASATIAGTACVIDGDSLIVGGTTKADGWCRKDGVEVRLYGVDAMEHDQVCARPDGSTWPCGTSATDFMRSIAAGRQATCQAFDRGRYGRMISVCLVDGVNVNRAIVRAGLAVAYRRYSDRYVADEDAARSVGKGIWSGSFDFPEDWRHKKP